MLSARLRSRSSSPGCFGGGRNLCARMATADPEHLHSVGLQVSQRRAETQTVRTGDTGRWSGVPISGSLMRLILGKRGKKTWKLEPATSRISCILQVRNWCSGSISSCSKTEQPAETQMKKQKQPKRAPVPYPSSSLSVSLPHSLLAKPPGNSQKKENVVCWVPAIAPYSWVWKGGFWKERQ